MKKDVKERWVEALRSGKYEQGVGALCMDNGEYCCLGVLCEIEGLEKSVDTLEGRHMFTFKESMLQSYSGLPEDFAESIDIDKGQIYELIVLNDSRRSTFEEIGDWIDENL